MHYRDTFNVKTKTITMKKKPRKCETANPEKALCQISNQSNIQKLRNCLQKFMDVCTYRSQF